MTIQYLLFLDVWVSNNDDYWEYYWPNLLLYQENGCSFIERYLWLER